MRAEAENPIAAAPPDVKRTAPSRSGGQEPTRLSEISGYAWAIAGVTTATAAFWIVRRHIDPGQASLLYLPVVIACAVRFGFGPAVLGAILSFGCWDYFFIPPSFQLSIYSTRDWISLTVFLLAALTTAHLASRGKEQARQAEAREAETKMLYEASQVISNEIASERLLNALVEQVSRICDASRCLVLQCSFESDNLSIVASASDAALGPLAKEQIQEIAKAVIRHNFPIDVEKSSIPTGELMRHLNLPGSLVKPSDGNLGLYIPLQVHGISVGVLHVGARRDSKRFSQQEERVTLTLANHAAVVIARQQMAEDSKQQARQSAVLEERTRLAEEVHDTLSHAFTGIKFLLEAVDRVGPTPQAMECVAQARALAIEGAQEARRSVWALRPTALENAGDLAAAIRHLANQQAPGSGVVVEVRVKGAPVRLAAAVEENLFRICQEALTNIYRHSEAQKARVELEFKTNRVDLSIQDNGRGFAPDQSGGGHGFGMTTMADRSARIGGTINVESGPGQGTTITVSTPIASPNKE